MENFSFTQDIKKVNWGDTLSYNFLRGASAGLVIGLIFTMNTPIANNVDYAFLQVPATILFFMIVMPLVLIIFFIPYSLIIRLLNVFQGGGMLFILRILTLVFAMIPAIGDPVVKILHSFFPAIVAVEKPGWFQAKVIIFVLH